MAVARGHRAGTTRALRPHFAGHETRKRIRQAIAELGTIEVGASQDAKLQILSIEELLENQYSNLPDMADPYTGK